MSPCLKENRQIGAAEAGRTRAWGSQRTGLCLMVPCQWVCGEGLFVYGSSPKVVKHLGAGAAGPGFEHCLSRCIWLTTWLQLPHLCIGNHRTY